MISTFYDVLYVDLHNDIEEDIDNKFKIGDIRSVVYFDGFFYILANKCDRLLGTYLISLKEKDP